MKRLGTVLLAAFVFAVLVPLKLAAIPPEPAGQTITGKVIPTGFRVGKKTTSGTIVAPYSDSDFDLSAPDVTPPDGFEHLIGPAFGVFVAYHLGGPAWLQTELFYSRRGAKIEGSEDRFDYRLDYLEVPLLLRIVPLTGRVSPVVFGGPYGSLLLKARGVLTAAGRRESEDIRELFKSADYGLKAGAGVQFWAGRVLLLLEGRYTHGLADIVKDGEEGSVRNRGLAFLVGAGF